ncbi:Rieske (2Fe-2S) protein [Rhizobium sp. KVB221]|uniref:Rieske (2Fe-2S) protein n=1 Tax=Rhizobium setariae TaxID=2801340 RepID=A0A936YPI9_9HYPH|nr:Rieske (2Fe-2S) protein [Rhizobium setariae]MBL0374429.1 Rieske (2Fe-2S) protein [Rhizobium setariae]
MKHELIKIDDIPTTGSVVVPFFGRELHVYRAGERIRAIANTCLHFGGPLECREGKLVCAWHGAHFDMATGERESGPAPRDSKLMFLSTRVEGDALYYVWGD